MYDGSHGKVRGTIRQKISRELMIENFPNLRKNINLHIQFSSVTQSCPTLWPNEPQHARPPCPSPTPGVYPNSCPSSRWCHPAISSSVIPCHPLLLLPSIPPIIRVFSNESTLHMRWPKYWSFSFSISPSNEHPGLIPFRMDWLDLLAVQLTYWRNQICCSIACSAFWICILNSFYVI